LTKSYFEATGQRPGILDYLLYGLTGGVFTVIGISFLLWLRF